MTKAERYAQHVLKLAGEQGVEVVIRGSGIAYRKEKLVTISPITGQVSYLVALHEIGHIAIRPEPPLRLAQEAAAWRWALDNSLEEPSLASWRSIFRRIDSYRRRQERWASMKRSPEFEEFHAYVAGIIA